MSKLSEIANNLYRLAKYVHDPDILRETEEIIQDKLEQLDGRSNETEKVRKLYHDEISKVIKKNEVSPKDLDSILTVFETKL